MDHPSFDSFLKTAPQALARGPIAMILVEDQVEVESTITHHLSAGFKQVLVFLPPQMPAPALSDPRLHLIRADVHAPNALSKIVNPVIRAVRAGTWLYYCYNAEYLFWPFSETRSIGELLGFHSEERREAMLTYVIDLYAQDLSAAPSGVDLATAMLDQSGYYALNRSDTLDTWHERQYDFFGGLRWRFEEFVPEDRRKIDRIALFTAQPDLALRETHLLSNEEYNTFACPWHNNLTAAICSFRVAKALKANPSSNERISNFTWSKSVRFEWRAQQLMDLGLMEPGQWF